MCTRAGLPTLPINSADNEDGRWSTIDDWWPLIDVDLTGAPFTGNVAHKRVLNSILCCLPSFNLQPNWDDKTIRRIFRLLKPQCHLYTVLRVITLSLLLSSSLISNRFLNCLFVSKPASYCLWLWVIVDKKTETAVSLNMGRAMQQPANNAHLWSNHGLSVAEIIPWKS